MTSFFNKSQLQGRGWTPAAITSFLGEPDKSIRNPRRRSSMIRLFLESRVLEAENSVEWKKWKQGSLKRSESAKKAARVKRQATLDKAASRLHKVILKDKFKGLSEAELEKIAISRFEEREFDREIRSGGNYTAEQVTSRRGSAFLERITVNFLRHEGTIYDRELDTYFSAIGVNQAKDMVREHVYGLIKEEYPHLGRECDHQLALRREISEYALGQDVSSRSASLT